MKSNYIPLEDRVVVSVPKKEDKTKSGIYTGDVNRTPLREVIVVAVGDGVKSDRTIKMFLKPGQRAVVGNNTGHSTEYTEDNVTYRIIRQEDFLFLVDESK